MKNTELLSAMATEEYERQGRRAIVQDPDVWEVYRAGNVPLEKARFQVARRARARRLGIWDPGACAERAGAYFPPPGQFSQLVNWLDRTRETITLDPSEEQAKGQAAWAAVERQARDIEDEPRRPDDQPATHPPETSDGPSERPRLDAVKEWLESRKTDQPRQRVVRYPLTDDGPGFVTRAQPSEFLCH